ncbi:interleukin-1 receptor-associated kinase 4 [Vigna unguiculata]|uniref:Interleukin-1 receptor-associated kinase 4 n=1 Tax=Vigna unguiculata TaxID=3917 RepID=A0A4D6MC96_VIGUN|nr:interleukin-1 receptor-associated kinase 4 [Vigna unguiculata]
MKKKKKEQTLIVYYTMELKVVMLLLLVIALARTATAAVDQALPGCLNKCGDVSIPYPFGVGVSKLNGKNCSFERDLELNCTKSSLYTGNIPVLNISLLGQLEMDFLVSAICKVNISNGQTEAYESSLRTASFTISSTENKFLSIGCDTYGYLTSYVNQSASSTTGCVTKCWDNLENLENMQTNDGKCAGRGCCQVDIPPRMKNIGIQAYTFTNFSNSFNPNSCSVSFVVKNGGYNFSRDHLNSVPFDKAPMIVDWSVGDAACNVSKDKTNYACISDNSFCEDPPSGNGYLCKCKPGFQGNPYLYQGCTDFPDCKMGTHNCARAEYCHETPGSFECLCPDGMIGNATNEGGGCQPKQQADEFTKIVIGAGVGLIALFVGVSWLYLMLQKRRVLKLKEKFFQQNGGIILRHKLSTTRDSSQSTTIFNAEQLNKATNNFDENLIIGKGGFGTVFKGVLSNNQVVAIKKSKIVDASQVEQFINEVIILSQINHRNVVKLLGCCLETEVPLLVYEFVKNGTLFDYLHKKGQVGNVSWKTRLRIATEAAGALSYLHSAASIPIIHRDVKTANILLDDNGAVKVSDFGASRLVPQDQTEIATIVQGTFGYLDPEYMQSGQLTEKSDVYSFGVVLVELLTREEPFSFQRTEEKRSLTFHFVCSLEEDNLFDVVQIDDEDEENKHEIMQVAILAARCLKLRGEERPSMKEVAMELEGVMLMNKHPWTNSSHTFEERQYLLFEAQSIREPGDSSGQQNTRYDSARELQLIDFGNGR